MSAYFAALGVFLLIAWVVAGWFVKPHQTTVHLKDGRNVPCLEFHTLFATSYSCDWAKETKR